MVSQILGAEAKQRGFSPEALVQERIGKSSQWQANRTQFQALKSTTRCATSVPRLSLQVYPEPRSEADTPNPRPCSFACKTRRHQAPLRFPF